MKFYKDNDYYNNYWLLILDKKLNAIYNSLHYVVFFKNGKRHNAKNAAFIANNVYKEFNLNGNSYGYEDNFTKESWRRFCKLKVFL